MRKTFQTTAILIVLLALVPLTTLGQITTKKVSFPKGKSSTSIAGAITGDQTIDYTVSLKENQELKVSLKANINACYFNILPPGSDAEAIFMGETEGNSFGGTMSMSGTYKIRVYLMRSAARKGTKANFTLNVSAK